MGCHKRHFGHLYYSFWQRQIFVIFFLLVRCSIWGRLQAASWREQFLPPEVDAFGVADARKETSPSDHESMVI